MAEYIKIADAVIIADYAIDEHPSLLRGEDGR